MEREVGGGIGMGNTCKPMAVSFQCMTKFTTKKKKKEPAKGDMTRTLTCHGILQVIIIEWVVMPSSGGSSRPRDGSCVPYVSCIGRRVLHHYSHLEAH